MELIRLTDHVWYSVHEEERDRPCLGYIKGERWSLAVDAGHSDAHVMEFYAALQEKHLPLPDLTVLTHWHWDHTFGMHSVHGLTMANERTNRHLADFAGRIHKEGAGMFLSLDPSIRKEYAGGKPVKVVPADIVFTDHARIELGGVSAELFTCRSPHTDDTTLVLIPEEKVLFAGDCICGVFPTWERDPTLTADLIKTLSEVDADHIVGGHWPVFSKAELLAALADEAL